MTKQNLNLWMKASETLDKVLFHNYVWGEPDEVLQEDLKWLVNAEEKIAEIEL